MDDIMFIGNFTQKTYLEKMLGGTIMSELNLSAEVYYKKAEEMLEKKDLLEFTTKIGIAEVLAEEKEMLAKIKFLRAKGYFIFNQYKKALELIPEAINYVSDDRKLKLKCYEGVIWGYMGDYQKAKRIFIEQLDNVSDMHLLVEYYLNIVWVNLSLYKNEFEDNQLEEAKMYLDLANKYFESVSDEIKRKINVNYSVYYCYKKEYDLSIDVLLKTINIVEEKELPRIYNNLAEIYLESDTEGVSDRVKEYNRLAEVIGNKYGDNFSIAKTFFTDAMAELRGDQLFKALDSFYLALEYFKKAEKYSYAFECLVKINDIIDEYKLNNLSSLKINLKKEFKDTPFYQKL